MPSDIMNSDQFVQSKQIIQKQIKVKRINNTNSLGSRLWFVVQDEDGILYQKWTMLMDESDAILSIAQPGDTLMVWYWIEEVSDPVFRRVEDFTRYNITDVEFV